mmetsp:Transcript_27423/g.40236  ORF Transcript_27423/g.40236 Transcript_27423/m.40236 type:complete len:211 (-) Transcript_27423:204-836(-)|eukprot:CAMPEP_0194037900 /NCGR_PEP_ID=MMETSP0009_2-20130614/10215_1 /TAXON_ID=210454 /ORGANISM="Grammatophora oceanica, Strain CCMP 410" /LENGTH=210 /DNA_ID=CAMNT_0038680239 /DNA_START=113 /DNA_END=745 /DNA_ORIENTATION=+
MTWTDVVTIVVAVGTMQLIMDLALNHFVFKKETYTDLLDRMRRAQFNLEREQMKQATKANPEKMKKRLELMTNAEAEAKAKVAAVHMRTKFYGAMAFLLMYTSMSATYAGASVGILPFAPWSFIHYISRRGLPALEDMVRGEKSIDPGRGCAFLGIYLLATLSIKYYVSEAFGTHPPKGADGGLFTMMDAPEHKKRLRKLGIDPDEFKLE